MHVKKENYAFENLVLITGEPDRKPIDDAVILVKNKPDFKDDDATGMILDAGSGLDIPSDYTRIDLKGMHVIPGLINAHCHLIGDGKPRFNYNNERRIKFLIRLLKTRIGKKLAFNFMRSHTWTALNAGVTTLRCLGDPLLLDVKLRDLIDSGRILGPRLLVSGTGICVTGGHGSMNSLVADSPWEARRAVRLNLREGVDWIKLISTGGVMDSRRVGEAGRPQMTVEEISAACNEAHRAGVLVAAHAESRLGVEEALLGGVDTVEHGADLDDDLVELFRHNKKALRGYSSLIPTLSAGLEITKHSVQETRMSRVQMENARLVKDSILSGFRKAMEGGVEVGLGTDASVPFVTHYNLWRELKYYTEAGNITPMQAIYHATLGNAKILNINSETGSVVKGKSADFLVVGGDPLEDLSVLALPRMIVIRGHIIKKPAYKKIKYRGKII